MSSAADTPTPPASRPNPFGRIAGLVGAPDDTMRDIAQRPDWIVPMLLILVISVALNFIALPHIDLETQMREQWAEQNVPEEKIDEMIENMAAFQKYAAPITALSVAIMLIALAALYMLLTRIFGGEGSFKQFLSVTTYAWMPQIIKGILAVLLLVRAGTVTPQEMAALLKSNLGFLVDAVEQPALFAVLSSIDLFNLATLGLMVLGYGYASRLGHKRAAMVVIASYVVWILARVGIALLQS